jgi:hypothetical protein
MAEIKYQRQIKRELIKYLRSLDASCITEWSVVEGLRDVPTEFYMTKEPDGTREIIIRIRDNG